MSRHARFPAWFAAACLAVALPGASAAAGAVPVVADREISALIEGLETSPCRFQRNGRWYDGERAAAHLRRKYAYLRRRGGVDSAERFIELAASRSSLSGLAYRVQCGDADAMDSAAWFRARLGLLREPKPVSR